MISSQAPSLNHICKDHLFCHPCSHSQGPGDKGLDIFRRATACLPYCPSCRWGELCRQAESPYPHCQMLMLNLPKLSLLTGFQKGPLPRNHVFCLTAEGSGGNCTLSQIIAAETRCPVSTVHAGPLGKHTRGSCEFVCRGAARTPSRTAKAGSWGQEASRQSRVKC